MDKFKSISISPKSLEAIKSFKLPEDLAFGKVMAPVMIESNYDNGKWDEFKMVPYQQLTLDPTCKALHYAQEIFEGLKGYHTNSKGPFLFRPEENMKRFNLSAKRMAMAEIPEEAFLDGVDAITSYCSQFIPVSSGDSLYIRPFMFASENSLGIKPSEKFKFLIVASPSQAYFKSGSVKVLVEEDAVRACPGGVGHAKTGGNYAASLLSMINANKKGYDQVLWLDAVTKENIEEMSGMNFFAVYGKKLRTPELTETILNGITRKSIIELATHLGYEVEEKTMKVSELVEDVKSGACSEAFACGTAVIITPINTLGLSNGETFPLQHEQGPVAMTLRKALLDIQEGTGDDPFGWRKTLSPQQ
jgi:branched-chain amino acid aminotransferase